jgi:hypothetical protein
MGELVLVRNNQIEMSHDRKPKVRYLGPYVVSSRSQNGYYLLNELNGARYNPKVTPARLLPYITRKHAFMKGNARGRLKNLDMGKSGSSSSESDESSNS